METRIVQYIQRQPRQTVTLADLEGAVPGDTTYQDFAQVIQGMEERSLLLPVKRQWKQPQAAASGQCLPN